MSTRNKQSLFKRGWQTSSLFRESIFDRIQALYEACDLECKGYVTQEDLQRLQTEIAISNDEIRNAFTILDTDNNGQLSLEEFSAGFGVFLGIDQAPCKVKKQYSSEKQPVRTHVRHLFDVLDRDKKGFLLKADLLKVAKDINITEKDVDHIFNNLSEGSTILTFDEFAGGWDSYLKKDFDSPVLTRRKKPERVPSTSKAIMDVTAYDPNELRVLLRQKATELFRICDQGNKHYISKPDLLELTKELALTKDQVESAFDKLDKDQNQFLTLDEFVDGFGLFLGVENQEENDPVLQAQHAEVQELFQMCDQGSKGYVTKNDLRRLSAELNFDVGQVNEIFDRLDEDANGFLTIYEFMQGFSDCGKAAECGIHDPNASEATQVEIPRTHFDDTKNTSKIERLISMEVLDSDAGNMLDDIGENVLADALTKEQLQDLWKSLSRNDTITLSKFEEFLFRVVGEIKKAKTETAHLENTLRRRALSHDMEVQRLYEEMEQQIKLEKSMMREKELRKEKAMREDLVKELEEKESALQKMGLQQKLLEKKLHEIHLAETDLRTENSKLLQENMELEDQLNDSMTSLEETREYVVKLQEVSDQERQEKAKVAVQATEGMVKEHESLIHQLDLLREMNQKLRDDRDAIEQSLNEGLHRRKPPLKKKLTREGSNMSKYFFGIHADSEKPLASTGDRNKLEKQGSVMSNYFESSCGSQESIAEPLSECHEESTDETDAKQSGLQSKWKSNAMTSLPECEDEADRQSRRDSGFNSPQAKTSECLNNNFEDHIGASLERAHNILTSTPRRNSDPDDVNNNQENSSLIRNGPTGTEAEVTPVRHTNARKQVEVPQENPSRVYKVVFIGDSGVGKSSFIHRLCFDDFLPNFSATIGVDFQVKTMKVLNQWVALQLWDTAGQERFRSITRQYFRKADGVVIMYDISSETSFKNMRAWMESVEEGAGTECTIMVIGNKKDLATDLRFRSVKKSAISRFIKDYNCLYEEASAKSGIGVAAAIDNLAQVLEKKEDTRLQSHILNLEMRPTDSEKKKGCCS